MKRLLAIIVIIAICCSYSAFALPSDYIAAWDFESETSGKMTDLSGNGYHGVFRKTDSMLRTFAQGVRGSYGLVIPNTAVTDTQMNASGLGQVLASKNAVTITGWFKNNGDLSKERYLFNIPNTVGNVGFSASVQTNGKLKLQVRTTAASGNLKSITTNTAPTTNGEWYHYAFSVKLPSDSAGKGILAIYVNGAKEIEDTAVDVNGMTALSTLGAADYDFRLGGNGSYVYFGSIDDVMVFDRVLSDNEIRELASPGVATQLNSFTVGGNDALHLSGFRVNSLIDTGAELYANSFPVTGVQIGLSDGSKQRISELSLNGSVVSPGSYASLALQNGDVLTYAMQGDVWESNDIKYYKLTIKSAGVSFSAVGFYEGDNKLTAVKPGTFTAKAVVSSSYEQSDNVYLIAIVRDNETGFLTSVNVNEATVSSAAGAVTLQASVMVNNDSRKYDLELYLTDKDFKAFTEVVSILGA